MNSPDVDAPAVRRPHPSPPFRAIASPSVLGPVVSALLAAGCVSSPPRIAQRIPEAPVLTSNDSLIQTLDALASRATGTAERQRATEQVSRVQHALRQRNKPPIPERISFFSVLLHLVHHGDRRVGTGRPPHGPGHFGLSGTDRAPDIDSAIFREPPRADSSFSFASNPIQDACRPDLNAASYAGPKTGFGTKPGFDVLIAQTRLKVKLAEVHSEPLTQRLFHSLGYHVDPAEFCPEIRVRYDRRLLLEFNRRRPLTLHVRVLHLIPIARIPLQPRHDPFRHLRSAILADGAALTPDQLRAGLFPHLAPGRIPSVRDAPDPAFESRVGFLVFGPVNLQRREGSWRNLGPSDFALPENQRHPELRAAGLLAAWLGWFDSRPDNTRLQVRLEAGGPVLRHAFTDLGGGLGAGMGLFTRRGEDANAFEWDWIERDPGRAQGFRIPRFRTLTPTPAFRNLTREDALAMARLIGTLSETDLAQALIAAGYDAATARLYHEKLVDRRDAMVRVLGLETSIPLLRAKPTDRNFNYDPPLDGPFRTVDGAGRVLEAPVTGTRIVRGRLVHPAPAAPTPSPSRNPPVLQEWPGSTSSRSVLRPPRSSAMP